MAGGEKPYMGWTSPNHAFRKQQAKQVRDLKARCQVYEQSGFVDMTMPATSDLGEASYTMKFNYLFIERPTFLSGAELGESEQAVPNKYPQITACVGDWHTSTAGYATIWKGATIYVSIAAVAGQKFYIHYTFTGKAMSSTVQEYTDGSSS